ncbi:MAG TPA: amino acid permease, partial [Negativicutes bacterium]|nr:amino acid permease [Negativicutes bacterium]
TGIEAISNGVTMFKPPQAGNAVATTYWMAGLLGTMLAGLTFLIMHFHIQPVANVTMLSQVAELTLGRGWLYYFIQITTMAILYLAANTSYNGLPPLLSLLARDGYMPRYLGLRGDRLSFSNGIILLSAVAGALIISFRGNVEHLIALYAIGVFLSFTIAQSGLVRRWCREREKGWHARVLLNGVGAVITGIVVLVIAVSKFFDGAWIVLVFIPAMVYVFKMIHRHYDDMAEQLHLACCQDRTGTKAPGRNFVVVPISTPTSVVADTINYAKLISRDIIALHVSTDEETGRRVQEKWREWNPGIPLETINSPYRVLITPVLQYIEQLEKTKRPEDYITVLIPEFETRKWWHRLLHNQTGWILRTLLILRENVIVSTIPYHLTK